MLPRYQSRLITLIAAGLASCCIYYIYPILAPQNASTGITFSDATAGPLTAITLTALALIPALLLSIIVAAINSYLSAIFIASFALLTLAYLGGSPLGFLYRSDLPHDYTSLIIESLIWAAFLFINLYLIHITQPHLQKHLPKQYTFHPTPPTSIFSSLKTNQFIALLITTALGCFLTNLLIQSTATSQSIFSLILAFFLATLITRFIIPSNNPALLLFAPILAAIVGYTLILINQSYYTSTSKILTALYANQFPTLAFPLPIFFISAGTLGAILGLTTSKTLDTLSHEITHTTTSSQPSN